MNHLIHVCRQIDHEIGATADFCLEDLRAMAAGGLCQGCAIYSHLWRKKTVKLRQFNITG